MHVFDYENDETRFKKAIDEMVCAKKDKGIKYHLGYTNVALELWMVLHKRSCNGPVTKVDDYLKKINLAYAMNFGKLGDYKAEKNFKGLLQKIDLNCVYQAILKADKVIENCLKNGCQEQNYKGFLYFRDNPSLSLHEDIKCILEFCVKRVNECLKDGNRERQKTNKALLPYIDRL